MRIPVISNATDAVRGLAQKVKDAKLEKEIRYERMLADMKRENAACRPPRDFFHMDMAAKPVSKTKSFLISMFK